MFYPSLKKILKHLKRKTSEAEKSPFYLVNQKDKWTCGKHQEEFPKDFNFRIENSSAGVNVSPERLVRPDLMCQQKYCGCNKDPFIWVSHSQNAVFFENPKAASSSIKNALEINPHFKDILWKIYLLSSNNKEIKILFKISRDKYPVIRQFVKMANSSTQMNSAQFFHSKRYYLPYFGGLKEVCEEFSSYYKFGFIRNPFSRMASNYRMFTQVPFRRRKLEDLYNQDVGNLSFREFVEEAMYMRNHHWEEQNKYIPCTNQGKPKVDYLGKLENIENDWAKIQRELPGVSDLPMKNKTQTEKRHYKDYYDDYTKSLVRKWYKKDLEYFDYSF